MEIRKRDEETRYLMACVGELTTLERMITVNHQTEKTRNYLVRVE
jgi:hypothetical protein